MPLWNKRAVSSGQTEESYKEQLQSLKQTVNNLGLVSEQFEGAAEGPPIRWDMAYRCLRKVPQGRKEMYCNAGK